MAVVVRLQGKSDYSKNKKKNMTMKKTLFYFLSSMMMLAVTA
jgi:hypothetical protein